MIAVCFPISCPLYGSCALIRYDYLQTWLFELQLDLHCAGIQSPDCVESVEQLLVCLKQRARRSALSHPFGKGRPQLVVLSHGSRTSHQQTLLRKTQQAGLQRNTLQILYNTKDVKRCISIISQLNCKKCYLPVSILPRKRRGRFAANVDEAPIPHCWQSWLQSNPRTRQRRLPVGLSAVSEDQLCSRLKPCWPLMAG